jgi:hypothetical protein
MNAGYTSVSFTSPTVLLVMGKESQNGQEKDGEMQEGSHHGHGQLSSYPPCGKRGNWHLIT